VVAEGKGDLGRAIEHNGFLQVRPRYTGGFASSPPGRSSVFSDLSSIFLRGLSLQWQRAGAEVVRHRE